MTATPTLPFTAVTKITADEWKVHPAAQLIAHIFEPTDNILYRPVESLMEGGKKRNRTLWKETGYSCALAPLFRPRFQRLLAVSAAEHANVFYGVCPRIGKGGFDKKWQIRVARCLWADIDGCSPDEAAARCATAKIPAPTAIVSSGNGTHLYWRLDKPYLIDDAPPPPQLMNQWVDVPGKSKKVKREYYSDPETKERLYLDEPQNVPALSERAMHLEDILTGIAAAIGGDHTQDISRLLRLPGTMNRKDERNGREPKPCNLVAIDTDKAWPIVEFERLVEQSLARKHRVDIAAVRLPTPRSPSPSKRDRLNELLTASATAPVGGRSQCDFNLCCFAIRSGIDKETLWTEVQGIGKFSEAGRRYFDRTWDASETEAREELYKKVAKTHGFSTPSTNGHSKPKLSVISADGSEFDGGDDLPASDRPDEVPTITVCPSEKPVKETMAEITNCLLEASDTYRRQGQVVSIQGDDINPILASQQLAGHLNQHIEFLFVDSEGNAEYKPLPSNYGSTFLSHRQQIARLPEIKMYTRCPVYAPDWRLCPPGYDRESGIYYAGLPVKPIDGTDHIDHLLEDFCFRNPVSDRSNYLGLLLTSITMPHFIGAHPGGIFGANQAELGKTILAMIVAILRDGKRIETVSFNPNDEEFEKRIGALVRQGSTTIVIDNAKANHGKTQTIESACLERCLTDYILSFRLLGFSNVIRCENSHQFLITANAPEVSRDLFTRSVVVNLYHEGDPESRQFKIADIEEYAIVNRTTILAELLGMIERWKASGSPLANVHSRFNKRGWAQVIGGILESSGEPDFLARSSADADELDPERRDYSELVFQIANASVMGPMTAEGLIEVATKHKLLTKQIGEGSDRSKTTRVGLLISKYKDVYFFAKFVDDKEWRGTIFKENSDSDRSMYRLKYEHEKEKTVEIDFFQSEIF